MVVIDATLLLLLLRPNVGVPLDESTKQPVSNFASRLAYWIETTEKAGDKIVIPAPALSEALVYAGTDGPNIVAEISKQSVFVIWPFDAMEAVELALLTKADIDRGMRLGDEPGATKAKVKFDRQIVAIAKVAQATTIYTDDKGIRGFATRAGLAVVKLSELPERPLPKQQDWVAEEIAAPDLAPASEEGKVSSAEEKDA